MAAVPPVGGARITAASALGLRAARRPGSHDEYDNFNFDSTRKTAGIWEPLPALGSAAPGRDTSAPGEGEKLEATFTFFSTARLE